MLTSTTDRRRRWSVPGEPRARYKARAGFTLVELVLVLLLAATLSGLAVPSLSGLGQAKANIAATQVRSLCCFAQQWAIGTGRPTWVRYDAATKRISAFQAQVDDERFASRVPLPDPLTKSPLEIDLGQLFGSTDPINDLFGGSPTLKFDAMGTPVDSNDDPLTSDVLIPLTAGASVRIRAGTGLIYVL